MNIMKTPTKIATLAGGTLVGLTVLGLIVGPQDEAPSEQPTTVEAETSQSPEPAPEPTPEPEPATQAPAPAPRPTPEPEPVEEETFIPPNAEDDLARIVLDSVWRDTSYADQQDMCLLYNLSPDMAWDAFSGGDEGGAISRNVFDEHFTEEC